MIGKVLKRLRIDEGYTLKDLGEIVGVSESTMSLYEHDKRDPDYSTLLKLADELMVSTDYLLGNSNIKIRESTASYGELSEEEALLLRLFRKVPSAQRTLVLNMIRAALENR